MKSDEREMLYELISLEINEAHKKTMELLEIKTSIFELEKMIEKKLRSIDNLFKKSECIFKNEKNSCDD